MLFCLFLLILEQNAWTFISPELRAPLLDDLAYFIVLKILTNSHQIDSFFILLPHNTILRTSLRDTINKLYCENQCFCDTPLCTIQVCKWYLVYLHLQMFSLPFKYSIINFQFELSLIMNTMVQFIEIYGSRFMPDEREFFCHPISSHWIFHSDLD